MHSLGARVLTCYRSCSNFKRCQVRDSFCNIKVAQNYLKVLWVKFDVDVLYRTIILPALHQVCLSCPALLSDIIRLMPPTQWHSNQFPAYWSINALDDGSCDKVKPWQWQVRGAPYTLTITSCKMTVIESRHWRRSISSSCIFLYIY